MRWTHFGDWFLPNTDWLHRFVRRTTRSTGRWAGKRRTRTTRTTRATASWTACWTCSTWRPWASAARWDAAFTWWPATWPDCTPAPRWSCRSSWPRPFPRCRVSAAQTASILAPTPSPILGRFRGVRDGINFFFIFSVVDFSFPPPLSHQFVIRTSENRVDSRKRARTGREPV